MEETKYNGYACITCIIAYTCTSTINKKHYNPVKCNYQLTTASKEATMISKISDVTRILKNSQKKNPDNISKPQTSEKKQMC